MEKKLISIIVAVYKNELSIYPFLTCLEEVIQKLVDISDFEIIIVNDGTPDRTIQEVDLFIQSGTNLKIKKIELSRNFGQTNAILAGMSVANSDAIINISADLQDPPELIEEIIKKYIQGNKIIICARQKREDGYAQRITSAIGYFFLGLGTQAIPKGGFDYFLMDRETVKYLLALKGRFRFIQGDILSLGFKPYVINYIRKKRIYGPSSYSFSRRLQVFVDSFVDISFVPIKTVTRVGFFTALIGFFLAILSLVSFINGSTPFSGFTAIFVTILIFGGFQLMAMGLIGEYIFRIYDMNRERPVFIIKNSE